MRDFAEGHPYDVFRNRVIFPIFDLNGEVVAFAGRRLNENDEREYVNTSDTPALREESKVIFGMNFAKRSEAGSLIVCEGPVDAIALQHTGFDNAVATQGTAITADQVLMMSRFVKTVYLAYDIDKAGERELLMKAIHLFTQVGVAAKVIDLGTEAKDPDEYIKKFGAEAFRCGLDASAGQVDFRIDEILGCYSLSLPDEAARRRRAHHAGRGHILQKRARGLSRADVGNRRVRRRAVDGRSARPKKAEEKQKAEQRRRTVNEALGYGDRVNRDRLTYATGALLEERLLACMLSNPALAAEACETLSEDDFLTAFGKKVFAAYAEEFAEGTEVVLSKDGLLEPEEISALARLMAKHDKLLSVMPDDAAALVRALKEERLRVEFNERIDENPQEALEEYIRLKRQKKTRPGDGGGEE